MPTPLSQQAGMMTAMDHARRGAQRSEQKFTEAANEVTQGFIDAANSMAPATENTVTETPPTEADADVISGIVDMRTAELAYRANLEVIQTADEMTEEALDILA